MSASELEPFLVRARSEWPDYRISIRPWVSDECPSVRYFLNILNVPMAELSRVSRRAVDLSFEIHGNEPAPFFLTACDPATSATYFPDQVAGRHGA